MSWNGAGWNGNGPEREMWNGFQQEHAERERAGTGRSRNGDCGTGVGPPETRNGFRRNGILLKDPCSTRNGRALSENEGCRRNVPCPRDLVPTGRGRRYPRTRIAGGKDKFQPSSRVVEW